MQVYYFKEILVIKKLFKIENFFNVLKICININDVNKRNRIKKTSSNKPIQLGLCCLNMTLRGQKPTVFTSRKMVVKSIIEQGIDPLKEKSFKI